MVHLFATPAPRSAASKFMLSPPPLLKRKRSSSSSSELDFEVPSLTDSSLFLPIFSNNDIAISSTTPKKLQKNRSSLPSIVLKPRFEKRSFEHTTTDNIVTPKKKRKTMSRTSFENNENDVVVDLEPKGLSFDDALMVEEITSRQRRTSLSLIEPVLVKEHQRAQRRSSSAGCA